MMKDEEMQSIVAEAKKNRFATVPKLGDEGILLIFWKGFLSCFWAYFSQQQFRVWVFIIYTLLGIIKDLSKQYVFLWLIATQKTQSFIFS